MQQQSYVLVKANIDPRVDLDLKYKVRFHGKVANRLYI